MIKKKNLIITWGVLFVGLKKAWLTPNEVIKLVNENSSQLSSDEDFLVELNVNEGDENALIFLLKQKGELMEEQAIKYWHHSVLMTIKQSNKSIEEKLKDIELQWSRFGYPEDWRSFIYYLPNEESCSNEGVYQIFLDYLNTATK